MRGSGRCDDDGERPGKPENKISTAVSEGLYSQYDNRNRCRVNIGNSFTNGPPRGALVDRPGSGPGRRDGRPWPACASLPDDQSSPPPMGACKLASCTGDTSGKRTFGFVALYKKGATTPEGLRIKIWDASETVDDDNQMGAATTPRRWAAAASSFTASSALRQKRGGRPENGRLPSCCLTTSRTARTDTPAFVKSFPILTHACESDYDMKNPQTLPIHLPRQQALSAAGRTASAAREGQLN